MQLTEQMMEAGKSVNNGFSVKQIRCLQEDMTRKGWYWRCLNKTVTDQMYQNFLKLKNAHVKKMTKRNDPKQWDLMKILAVKPDDKPQYKPEGEPFYKTIKLNQSK